MIILQQKTKQAKQTNKQTYLPIMAHLSNQIWYVGVKTDSLPVCKILVVVIIITTIIRKIPIKKHTINKKNPSYIMVKNSDNDNGDKDNIHK